MGPCYQRERQAASDTAALGLALGPRLPLLTSLQAEAVQPFAAGEKVTA